VLIVAGCAQPAPFTNVSSPVPHGTLTGTLLREGGAVSPGGGGPKAVPVDGTVSVASGSTVVATARASKGRFTLGLPPGTYTVTAVTTGGGSALHCSAASSARVVSYATTSTEIDCIVP